MSEIEKMYKLAQIANEGYDAWDMKDIYPPFTAEKQLELIKIFAKRELTINNTDYEFSFSISDGDEFAYTYITKKYFNSFENALANLTNTLWQDLTEEEKQQVKEILE